MTVHDLEVHLMRTSGCQVLPPSTYICRYSEESLLHSTLPPRRWNLSPPPRDDLPIPALVARDFVVRVVPAADFLVRKVEVRAAWVSRVEVQTAIIISTTGIASRVSVRQTVKSSRQSDNRLLTNRIGNIHQYRDQQS